MDLYAMQANDAEFTTFCGGNAGGENETCLSLAAIPGAQDAFILRDTKPEGAGAELRVTGEELRRFLLGAASVVGADL